MRDYELGGGAAIGIADSGAARGRPRVPGGRKSTNTGFNPAGDLR